MSSISASKHLQKLIDVKWVVAFDQLLEDNYILKEIKRTFYDGCVIFHIRVEKNEKILIYYFLFRGNEENLETFEITENGKRIVYLDIYFEPGLSNL